jgi:hypothetical protein
MFGTWPGRRITTIATPSAIIEVASRRRAIPQIINALSY